MKKFLMILCSLAFLFSAAALAACAGEPVAYTVTVINGTGGGEYEEGEEVILTPDGAPSGKEFDKWEVEGATGSTDSEGKYTFTMPANNVTAEALYKDVVTEPVLYSVTVVNGSGGGEYEVGEEVTLTPDTAPEGKKFEKWDVSGVEGTTRSDGSYVFTMPSNDVAAEAVFADAYFAPGTDELSSLEHLFDYSENIKVQNYDLDALSDKNCVSAASAFVQGEETYISYRIGGSYDYAEIIALFGANLISQDMSFAFSEDGETYAPVTGTVVAAAVSGYTQKTYILKELPGEGILKITFPAVEADWWDCSVLSFRTAEMSSHNITFDGSAENFDKLTIEPSSRSDIEYGGTETFQIETEPGYFVKSVNFGSYSEGTLTVSLVGSGLAQDIVIHIEVGVVSGTPAGTYDMKSAEVVNGIAVSMANLENNADTGLRLVNRSEEDGYIVMYFAPSVTKVTFRYRIKNWFTTDERQYLPSVSVSADNESFESAVTQTSEGELDGEYRYCTVTAELTGANYVRFTIPAKASDDAWNLACLIEIIAE